MRTGELLVEKNYRNTSQPGEFLCDLTMCSQHKREVREQRRLSHSTSSLFDQKNISILFLPLDHLKV
jgi:hypothetical protein